jgi:MFS transporter, SP family, general alpha glucoside:H+ symporter
MLTISQWGAKTGFFYGGTCLVSLVFTYFCIPEPKGRTFAELDILFQRKTPARQFATTPVNIYEAAIAEKYDME